MRAAVEECRACIADLSFFINPVMACTSGSPAITWGSAVCTTCVVKTCVNNNKNNRRDDDGVKTLQSIVVMASLSFVSLIEVIGCTL